VRGDIILHFRGYKKVAIPFYAKSTVPKLTIREEWLDFGEVSCGSLALLTFHLRNDSNVNGLLEVPLRTPELGEITLTTNFHNRRYINTVAKAAVALPEGSEHSNSTSGIPSEHEDEDSNEKTDSNYRIKVPPRHEIPFRLGLQFSKNGTFERQLPIFMIGHNEATEGITRNIRTTVVPACIHMSMQTVDFRRCIVSENSESRQVVIELTNHTNRNLTWKIENSQPRNEFSFVPACGAIA